MDQAPPAIFLRTCFVTSLPTGERVEVRAAAEGGHSYAVEADERRFGAYDTSWSADKAYEAGVNAARNRRKGRA